MKTAWMPVRVKRSAISGQRSAYGVRGALALAASASVLLAVLASVSCGPESQGRLGWNKQQDQAGKAPGPLANGRSPFLTADSATQGQQAPGDAAAGDQSLDPRVQKFVARFPQDDRDRQGRQTPTQTAAPNAGSGVQAITTKPPAGQPTAPAASLAGKPAPAVAPQASGANRPVAQPMQPVEMLATGPATASKGGTDVQASPQPLVDRTPSPLAPAPLNPRVELIDVRPAVGVPATMPSGVEPMPPANQPVQHTAVARAADLGAFLSVLEETVKAHPEQLDDQFRLRLLYLATDQDEKAAGPILAADPTQAGLATALFQVLTTAKAVIRQPTSAPAPALMATEELHRLLGQQSPVMIPKIAMVTRVNSFGDYEAVNPPKFTAGQGVHVFLYTEVSNFRSEPTTDNRLRTLLSEKVEIYSPAGKVIWQQAAENIEDKVLTPRRDFFIPLEVRLPADTPAGEYVLKVTIEDKLGATTDQQRMTFVIE